MDPQIAALLAGASATSGSSSSSSGGLPLKNGGRMITLSNGRHMIISAAQDPSAGPGTLELGIGPWANVDTHIPIPQWFNRGLEGAGQGTMDIIRHVGNLVGLVPDQKLAQYKNLDQPLLDTTAGKVGSLVGSTAATAPVGWGVGGLLGKIGLAARPILAGAATGAGQGLMTADPGSRLQGTVLGGALGAALPGVGGAVSKLVRGMARTPAAQTLLSRGVRLTPGQLNPAGGLNRIEQAFTSFPWLGGRIAAARDAAPTQYARAMVEDAMAPGAKLTSTSGDFNDLVKDASDSFDPAYRSALRPNGTPVSVRPVINPPTGNPVPLRRALADVAAVPRGGLTAPQRQALGDQLQEHLDETLAEAQRDGGMTADHLQQLRSTLRDAARDVSPIDNASRAQRAFWNDAQGKVTQALESQLPPDAAAALRATDAQYGKFAVIRDVARSLKDKPNVTPNMFSNAIAKATTPAAYATGGGFNRDLSKAGQQVFSPTVPMTGLTGAGIVAPAIRLLGKLASSPITEGGGALYALHNPVAAFHAAAPIAGIAGLGRLAYSGPGLRSFAGQTGWQQAAQRALGRLTSATTPAQRRLAQQIAAAGLIQSLMPRQPPTSSP
jgi:hypothetical protein